LTVSYTTAADRDSRRTRQRAQKFGSHDVLMWATTCVALLAISLAYSGRLRVFDATETPAAEARLVNLNTVSDAAEFEPAVAALFANPRDRPARRDCPRTAARGVGPESASGA
jgi:hypothetical protein